MNAHRRVWAEIQRGHIAVAVEMARPLLAFSDEDATPDWPIFAAYAIGASMTDSGSSRLSDLGHALGQPHDPARGLRTMIGMRNAIMAQDWYTATRMCARIRSAMKGASLNPYETFLFLTDDPDRMVGNPSKVDRYFQKLEGLITR